MLVLTQVVELVSVMWWAGQGLNLRPVACKVRIRRTIWYYLFCKYLYLTLISFNTFCGIANLALFGKLPTPPRSANYCLLAKIRCARSRAAERMKLLLFKPTFSETVSSNAHSSSENRICLFLRLVSIFSLTFDIPHSLPHVEPSWQVCLKIRKIQM